MKRVFDRKTTAREDVIFQRRATRAVENLQEPAVLGSVLEHDPLANAKLRGQLLRKELLEAERGVVGREEMGNLLGITRQAVDKRRKAGTLLALEVGKRFVYPLWQVEGNRTLDHLEEVLTALGDHDAWRKLSFFIHGNVRLGGASPLQALRDGNYNEVLQAARTLGEHGAA